MPASIDPDLLSVLACPKCKEDLTLARDEKGLICETCHVVYPIRNGVPVMLVEESSPLRTDKSGTEEAMMVSGDKVVLKVVEGKNKGTKLEIERGMCRAVGRSLDEAERTRIFNVESEVALDDASKKVVIQYVAKHFKTRAGGTPKKKMGVEDLGGFSRGPDFQINDLSVSRLHAMIFFDESGSVGILDLVSKNGTFVNGAEVESKMLKPGDLIAIGATKIRFEA